MVRLTQGAASIYGAPRNKKEKRRYREATGRDSTPKPKRYGSRQEYYASRSGPVTSSIEGLEQLPRFATPEQRTYVLKRDGYQCRYCGTLLEGHPQFNEPAWLLDQMEQRKPAKANIDHVEPYKHDGPTLVSNLVACCTGCNRRKLNQRDWQPRQLKEQSQRRK